MCRIKRGKNVAAYPVNLAVIVPDSADIESIPESLADSTDKYYLGNQGGKKAHPRIDRTKISLV